MSGFVALHREAMDHPLFHGDAQRLGAWLWLVARAAWKPTPFDLSGRIITLERGQLCASRSQMAKAWGMSESSVERYLARLQTEQMIGRETGQGRSIITICNYAKYQDISDEAGQATGRATGQRPDSDRTAKEQGNKGTRDKEPNGSSSQGAGEDLDGAPQEKPKPKPKPKTSTTSVRMTEDWKPGPLPADVAALVELWPPGRLEREAANVRDFWLEKTTKRPGWDRTFHNRIRDIHDRVLRESRNAGTYHSTDQRDGFDRAIDRRLFGDGTGDDGWPA